MMHISLYTARPKYSFNLHLVAHVVTTRLKRAKEYREHLGKAPPILTVGSLWRCASLQGKRLPYLGRKLVDFFLYVVVRSTILASVWVQPWSFYPYHVQFLFCQIYCKSL